MEFPALNNNGNKNLFLIELQAGYSIDIRAGKNSEAHKNHRPNQLYPEITAIVGGGGI